MAFVLPPPKNKKQAGQQGAYRSYINSHPSMRGYAQAIYKAAINSGIDPVYYASVLWKESFSEAKRQGVPVETIVSPTGEGVGIAQINPRAHPNITAAQMRNPAFAINWGAAYLAQGLGKYGNYDAAYRKHYNPGYRGPVFNDVPKGYVATGTQKSPTEAAQRSVDVATAKQDLTDPYVTIRNGKLAKADAKHAIKVFGQSLRRSQFLATWQNLNDLYLTYTGRPVTNRAVVDILVSGKSRYKIIDILARGPNFVGSPVWKQNAPGYQSVWSDIYGPNVKPDNEAIRYAIVNNLGGEGFAQVLRDRPDYVSSNKFKSDTATMSGVYSKIFGIPDQNGVNIIKQATIGGWSQDQFADWLRHTPEYGHSEEYQGKALYFAQTLGLVTGDIPTLAPGPAPTGNGAPSLPQDPRLPGAIAPNPNSVLAVSK
jgi:hypothetical protein